jgi:hypothetical protein
MDYDRAVVHGSMVDHGRRQPKGSPGRGLGAAPVSISSLALGEKKRKRRGFLPWVRVGGAVPEGGRRQGCHGGGDLLSTTRGSGRGETRVGAALNAVESG